jgi:hypothetical protein
LAALCFGSSEADIPDTVPNAGKTESDEDRRIDVKSNGPGV